MRPVHKNRIAEYLIQTAHGADAFEVYKDPNANQSNVTIIEFKNSPFVFKIEPFQDDYNAFAINYTRYNPRFGMVNRPCIPH